VIRLWVIGLMGAVALAGCGGDDEAVAGEGGSGGAGGEAATGGTAGGGGTGGGPLCFEVPALGGELGGPCRGDTLDCNAGLSCLTEFAAEIGGADDPIANYPPGEAVPIAAPLFVDNYCTPPPTATGDGCDPNACNTLCGICSQGVCLNACEPDLDSNSICREGYACDVIEFVCTPGCTSDDECRVARIDDGLVYNTSSEAVCNPATARCEHPGTPDAQAGDPCEFNDDCERNGTCIPTTGGYCSKLGCGLAGNECAGDGVCAGGTCVAPCVVGPTDGVDPTEDTQGCREDYTCYWGRTPGDASGFCDLAFFSEVTEPNVGADCENDDECYSPFGYGACDPDFGCTILECGAPGLPADICGEGAVCIDFIDLGVDAFACLVQCTTAEDCREGDACADLDGDPMTLDQVCFPACVDSAECRAGEVCDVNNSCVAP